MSIKLRVLWDELDGSVGCGSSGLVGRLDWVSWARSIVVECRVWLLFQWSKRMSWVSLGFVEVRRVVELITQSLSC